MGLGVGIVDVGMEALGEGVGYRHDVVAFVPVGAAGDAPQVVYDLIRVDVGPQGEGYETADRFLLSGVATSGLAEAGKNLERFFVVEVDGDVEVAVAGAESLGVTRHDPGAFACCGHVTVGVF